MMASGCFMYVLVSPFLNNLLKTSKYDDHTDTRFYPCPGSEKIIFYVLPVFIALDSVQNANVYILGF